MSCPVVTELPDDCGINEPGVDTLYIIRKAGVVRPLPAVDVDTHTISTDLTLVDALTEGMIAIPFLEGSCKLDENDDDNSLTDIQLVMQVPKDSAAKRTLFTLMSNGCCRYDTILVDKNGHVKFTPELKFKKDYTTGDDSTKNGYTITMTKKGRASFSYEGVIPTV